MARYRVKGPNGAEMLIEVPGRALDQRSFDARVESGELTVLETVGEPGGLSAMKIPELKAYASEHGIDLAGASKKADIVAAIEAG